MYNTISELGTSVHTEKKEAIQFAKDTLKSAKINHHIFKADPIVSIYTDQATIGWVTLDSNGEPVFQPHPED